MMNNDTFVTTWTELLQPSSDDLFYESNETTTPASISIRTTTDMGLSTVVGGATRPHEPHSSPPLEVSKQRRLILE